MVYQMDAKSTFLNGDLNEEVYTEQPKGFKQHVKENYVFKLKKELCRLKQEPRAWCEGLDKCLLQQGFQRGKANCNILH